MNEPLFELVSDEHGTGRRPVTPDPDGTPILADAVARWSANHPRLTAALRKLGRSRLTAAAAEPAQ